MKLLEFKPLPYPDRFLATVPDLGFRDEKGRVVGYQFVLYKEDQGAQSGRWCLRPHVLRDGKQFGALPRSHYFDSRNTAEDDARRKLLIRVREYSKRKDFTPGGPA
jgi:hypothetical protein